MGGSPSPHALAFRALGFGILVVWTEAARPAAAAERACTVTVVPTDAPEAWRHAARIAQERVRREGMGDCGALTIALILDRASVEFTTVDGRTTTRTIDTPDDLGPLLDALLVTLPREDPVPAPVAPPPSLAPAPPPDMQESHASAPASAASTRLALRAAAGARISSPGAFASPSFGIGAGCLLGAWEVSAFGVLDPMHALMANARPAGFTMSRYAVGVAVGRRAPIGSMALAAGLSTSVAVTNESGPDDGEVSGAQLGDGHAGGATAAEPLVATYVGFVYPRGSSIRLRPELSAEVVASRIGRTLSIDPALPPLPWWNGAATVAIEWEAR
jgi:hypothetical protein